MSEMAWLTVGEAARYLGVSEPALRKWTDAGRITTFRTPGGHRRYRLDALNRFREAQEERPPAARAGGTAATRRGQG